jgi:hypothetical protein
MDGFFLNINIKVNNNMLSQDGVKKYEIISLLNPHKNIHGKNKYETNQDKHLVSFYVLNSSFIRASSM